MKLNKVFLASMLAVSAATSAFATSGGTYDVVLRITGSTAFRKSTAQAISNIIVSNKRIGVVGGTDHTAANAAVYTGTLASGKTIMVQTNWSGSEAGFKAVAAKSQVALTWADDVELSGQSVGFNGQLTNSAYSGTNVTGAIDTANANIAMADNAQSESAIQGAAYNTLTGGTTVGVIPFVWIRGSSADSTIQTSLNSLTNITSQQAQTLFSGAATLSMWSNNYAQDVNLTVYVVGRDNLSGTRLNTLLESYGAAKTAIATRVVQAQLLPNAGNFAAVSGSNVTGYSINGDYTTGYTSGGNLVKSIAKQATGAVADAVFVGYAGISDVNATNYPGVTFDSGTGAYTGPVLSYNGVPFTYANVQNGSYTFWGIEHIAYGTAITGNGDAQAAVTTLTNEIKTNTASASGIKFSDMHVDRVGAGQAPFVQ